MLSRSSKVLRPALRGMRSQSTIAEYPQHYTIPHIPAIAQFQQTGIPGLLSAKGLDNAYFSRVANHVDQLNKEVTKLSLGGSASLEILAQQSATNVKQKKVHQHSSLTHNIAFAIGSLGEVRESQPQKGVFKPDEKAYLRTPDLSLNILNPPTQALEKHLIKGFGSIIEFKTLLLNSANAINGDGFTWLVARNNRYFKENVLQSKTPDATFDDLFVLNTYNAGSPRNNDRIGQLDELKAKAEKSQVQELESSTSTIPSFEDARFSRHQNVEYIPLLAIDASPKVWLHDYGVFGKKQYLEQVWKAIDWNVVETRLPEAKHKVFA